MAVLVPAIQVFPRWPKTWMPATSADMTIPLDFMPGSQRGRYFALA